MGVEVSAREEFAGSTFRAHARGSLVALLLASLLAAGLVLGSGSALAATGHPFLRSLALPEGAPNPAAVAVDSRNGDVLVADDVAGVIDVFGPSGEYLTQFGAGVLESNAGNTTIAGLAIDSSGRVYVADRHALPPVSGVPSYAGIVYVFRPDGFGAYNLLSEWRGPSSAPFGDLEGVAVDSSSSATDPAAGDVYVENGSAEQVLVFKPPPTGAEEAREGTLVSTLTGKPKIEQNVSQNNDLTVDSATGALYVANPAKKLIEVFNSAGQLERTIPGNPPRSFEKVGGLAVEEASGDLYVAEAETVAELNPAGELIGNISFAKTTAPFEPHGVAVDNSSGPSRGQVYVVDGATATVDAYGPGVHVPAVTTGKASGIAREREGKATATLGGTIDPEAEAASYFFEYREAGASAFVSTASAPVPGTSSTEVQTTVSLLPERTYEFRLVGESNAADSYGRVVSFTTAKAVAVLGVVTGAGTGGPKGEEATLEGAFDPKEIATTYQFEYGETLAYGTHTAPAPPTSSKTTVFAKEAITGLAPGRTYHFRIAATNEFGTTYGQDATFTTTTLAGPPVVSNETSEASASGGETLKGQVNPNGEAAKYHFEYGESEAYGQNTPEAEVPPGGTVPVSAEIAGLKPQTSYHFRLVASSAKGETKGPDATFTSSVAASAATPALLDGRAYEMVSPPNKHGGYIEPLSAGGSPIQASEDGNALAYVDLGSLVENPEGNLSPEAEQVISTRGPTSWSTQEIVTPTERVRGNHTVHGTEYHAFSSNLSLALLQPLFDSGSIFAEPPLTPPLSEAERGHQQKTIYLRANPPLTPAASEQQIYEEAQKDGERLAGEHGEPSARPGYVGLVTGANTAPGTTFGGRTIRRGDIEAKLAIVDATPDLTHVVLSSGVALTASPSAPGLYEWAGGKLQLVSVLPSTGQPVTPSMGRVELGSGVNAGPTSYRHAISDDGSRVIWSQTPPAEENVAGSPKLFLRDTTKGQTIQLDLPAPGVNQTPGRVVFQDASADGSKVFFTDTAPLTANAKAAFERNGEVEKPDLYECEIVEKEAGKLSCNLSDLSASSGTAEPASVQGVVGTSEDGTYVYIVATGVLAGGGQPGKDNLYELHQEGGAWSTKTIATLSAEDFPDWAPALGFNPKVVEAIRQTARVSPNGQFLAFMSNQRLTGYNNTDVNSGQADEEVFLYDANASEANKPALTCPSCNPSGARPRGVLDTEEAGEGIGLLVDRVGTWEAGEGAAARKTDHWLAGSIPGSTPVSTFSALRQPRYLSDSGRLFFTSADALVAEAAGRTRPETIVKGAETAAAVGVENVYEYEPTGTGTCASTPGCVALISSGTSEKESALLDASTSGNDVFFITDTKLLPQDTDSSYDAYDARVCTGSSPCQTPPETQPAACASSEACHPGGSSAQTFQPPSTATFSGPGNLVPAQPKGGTLPIKVSTPPPLTKAQKLARALKVCRRLPHKTHSQKLKRSRCERHARKLYKSKGKGK